MSKLQTIAAQVATNAKASGIGVKDLGCFYDDDWNLTDDEWDAVVVEAIRLYPTAKPSRALYRQWAIVNADARAEARSERFMFAA